MTFSLGEFTTELRFVDPVHAGLLTEASLFCVDSTVAKLYPKYSKNAFILSSGEEHKTWNQVEAFLGAALNRSLGRDSIIAGVGGGVACDLTAFAASLYMRGATLHLVPTTLLAMVDASFGGKTGIDFSGIKNSIGTFYPARVLWVWTGFLQSLPQDELMCGMAESIKAAFLGDENLYRLCTQNRDELIRRDEASLESLVKQSLLFKGSVVERDLRESGDRAFLNLGHTFGHGLEAVQEFKGLKHGQAVAWGIARAMDLGQALGITKPEWAKEVTEILKSFGYHLEVSAVSAPAILEAMRADKKKKSGDIRFVVQRDRGENQLVTAPDKLILETITRGIA